MSGWVGWGFVWLANQFFFSRFQVESAGGLALWGLWVLGVVWRWRFLGTDVVRKRPVLGVWMFSLRVGRFWGYGGLWESFWGVLGALALDCFLIHAYFHWAGFFVG